MKIFRFRQQLKHPAALHDKTVTFREGLYFFKNGSWGECSPLPGFSGETLEDVISSGFNPEYPSVALALSFLDRDIVPAAPESSYTYIGNSADLEQYLDEDDGCTCSTGHSIPSVCIHDDQENLTVPPDIFPFEKIFSDMKVKTASKKAKRRTEHPVFKLKVGRNSCSSESSAVHRLLNRNPDSRFILDPNMLWNERTAEEFLSSIPTDTVLYIEDPASDLKTSLKISDRFNIKLGLDELLRQFSISDVPEKDLGAIVIKPMLTGSLEKCEEIITRAADRNLYVTISSSYESILGLGLLSSWSREIRQKNGEHILLGLDTEKIFL